MNFLNEERQALERFFPGLDGDLARVPLTELEMRGSQALEIYRRHGGPGLVVPAEFGGRGASALHAVQVHRALAADPPPWPWRPPCMTTR